MKKLIGNCSNCGGNVSKEEMGYTVDPQFFEPKCEKCGAKKALPTIQMEKHSAPMEIRGEQLINTTWGK